MKKFEDETGKKAIWRGVITSDFLKWQQGEKIYIKNKERINILVSEEQKNKWEKFANENNIPTNSRLIRESVDFYIDAKPLIFKIKQFSTLSHDVKEKLSAIKGFSQILMQDYKDEISWDVLLKIKEIYDQSVNLEKIINDILGTEPSENGQYDILLVDDDPSTNTLLIEFFKKKGYICKGISLGSEAIELLHNFIPKLILLDILLPDNDGYEVCRIIKKEEKLKKIPIFYITAVPEIEVRQKVKETGANGYFLKPFDMEKFNLLLDYL